MQKLSNFKNISYKTSKRRKTVWKKRNVGIVEELAGTFVMPVEEAESACIRIGIFLYWGIPYRIHRYAFRVTEQER